MLSSRCAKFALIATLLFAHMVYAGHHPLLDNGSRADCQICLQASSGMLAPPCAELPRFTDYSHHAPVCVSREPVRSANTANPHPPRAPPHSIA